MRQLVCEELPPRAGLRSKRALGTEDVCAKGECLGVEGLRGLSCDRVGMDTDARQRDAELALHLATELRRERLAGAALLQGRLDRGIRQVGLATAHRAAIQRHGVALGRVPQGRPTRVARGFTRQRLQPVLRAPGDGTLHLGRGCASAPPRAAEAEFDGADHRIGPSRSL
jgi:hypothetical protein